MKQSYFRKSMWIAAVGCLMSLAVACGDDDDSSNPAPQGGSKNTSGSGGTGNDKGGEDTGGTKATGGTKPTAGTGNQTDGGGGAGTDVPSDGGAGGEGACTDDADKGCYKCAPKTREDFLNQCPSTGCQAFDNTKLTSLKNGKLPDLP